jgi:anti-anti-sigma regulatory factor
MTRHSTIRLERHSAELAVVALGGRLAHDARPEVAETLADAARRPGVEHVVVDLSGAGHVDPSVVNAVIQSASPRAGRRACLELVIPARAHMLRSLFETVGPTGIATVHETRGDAIATLTGTGQSRRAA